MNIAEFLEKKVALFKGLSPKRIAVLVDGSRTATFEARESVVHQGSEATHLGVVLKGTLAVSVLGAGATRHPIGTRKEGDTFCETALMTGEPLSADIIAETRSEVLLIPVSLLQSAIMAESGVIQQITKIVAERVKTVMANPAAAAALQPGVDPYGLELKGERPEKILVINCGSSSLKYSFFNTADPSKDARGLVERIGLDGTKLKHSGPKGETKKDLPGADFTAAFKAMIAELTAKETGVMKGASEISVVVHRVVHGGESFTEGTLITDEVLAKIETLSPLAPLHNPVNLEGIRAMQKLIGAVPHVAVFDTAFHHTLPAYAYLYGLPYELYEKKGVRRYGFHGTSHHYVSLRAAQFLQKRPNALRIISCHLGNGSSLCAIDHGRSVDTSMGFTPAEGLIMGTRCGDVDAGVLAFLERSDGTTAVQSEQLLNKKSGLLGLSGVSSDMREILKAADEGNHRALLAQKAFCYRVRKYIGSYVAAMGGLDTIIFTGGIGQGSAEIRALVLEPLEGVGVKLDAKRNREARGFSEVCRITTDDSRITVLVVPTDEERMMAREALRTIARSYISKVLEAQKQQPFLVEISAHHIHLTQEHVEALFGKGHQLTKHADLSQPGQFACKEQLTIVGPKGKIERVRVLGPTRKVTQIEIALTEQFKLGVNPPVRESGDIKDTPGCTLEGPAGKVELDKGLIAALRHVHMTPADALRYGVRDKSVVRVRIDGDRELIFGDVLVRVDPTYALAMHIDTDEANAAGIKGNAKGYIDAIQD
ncbi:MAG TPA: acetate/propionate family kinase [Candidatus Didemnitutus sp.]|nr:acetate/propionate family kinase [Candidatus Didemnitutus sp.]